MRSLKKYFMKLFQTTKKRKKRHYKNKRTKRTNIRRIYGGWGESIKLPFGGNIKGGWGEPLQTIKY